MVSQDLYGHVAARGRSGCGKHLNLCLRCWHAAARAYKNALCFCRLVRQSGGSKYEAITEASSGNITLWARWDAIKHKLTLELNGGALAEAITSYNEGVETVLPVPAKEYHDFVGWHEKSDLTDIKTDKITADKTGALTFYAEWSPKKYTVTLELNGGSIVLPLNEYTYGQGATLPVPEKAGNDFAGWFEAADFSGDEVTGISKTDNLLR